MKVILKILPLILLLSCDTETNSRTAILLDLKELTEFPHHDREFWQPKETDLKVANELMHQAYKENQKEFGVRQDTLGPNDYYKQFVPYLNEKGERIIYINGLCESFVKSPLPGERTKELGERSGWKNFFYYVYDGGRCFWQVEINVDKKEYFHFSVNGQ